MPDETEVLLASEEDSDAWMTIRNWYINNPGNEEEPALQYPLNIIIDDGVIITINSDTEMSEFEDEFCRGGNN